MAAVFVLPPFGADLRYWLFSWPSQVLVRIQTVLNDRLDQAEYDSTAGSALGSVGEQEVLPLSAERLNTSFSPVVAELQSAVFPIICQVGPLVRRLAKGRLRRSSPHICPRQKSAQYRFCLRQPLCISVIGRQLCQPLFNLKQKGAISQSLCRRTVFGFSLGQGFHCLVKLPSGMSPAARHRNFFRKIVVS